MNTRKQTLKSQIFKIHNLVNNQEVKLGVHKSTRRHFNTIRIQENYRENFSMALHHEIAHLANSVFTVLSVSNLAVFPYQN